jgi:hypothetical protein
MSSFADIKTDIRENLNDSGITYYSAADMTESMEDAYSDVLFRTRCSIKKVTLSFIAGCYYDFKFLGVEDFMCVIAIFNNNTNHWLLDDVTIKDLDSIRTDWEIAEGQPQVWCPLNFELNVIWPYLSVPTGTFDLYYAAKAANIDDDTDTPLIASDAQSLLEQYCSGDLLEQAEEYTKANEYFKDYEDTLSEYFDRVKNLARRDLLIKI